MLLATRTIFLLLGFLLALSQARSLPLQARDLSSHAENVNLAREIVQGPHLEARKKGASGPVTKKTTSPPSTPTTTPTPTLAPTTTSTPPPTTSSTSSLTSPSTSSTISSTTFTSLSSTSTIHSSSNTLSPISSTGSISSGSSTSSTSRSTGTGTFSLLTSTSTGTSSGSLTSTALGHLRTKPANLCKSDSSLCKDDDSLSDASISIRDLEKRGSRRKSKVNIAGIDVEITSEPYPSNNQLLTGPNAGQVLNKVLDFNDEDLEHLDVVAKAITTQTDIDLFVTEHILELQTITSFLAEASKKGKLGTFITASWKTAMALPNGVKLPTIGKGTNSFLEPQRRVFEAMGSSANRGDFVLCEEELNAVKARIWSGKDPMGDAIFEAHIKQSLDDQVDNVALTVIYNVIGVFKYLNVKEVNDRLTNVRAEVKEQLGYIEKYGGSDAKGLEAAWDSFIKSYLTNIQKFGKQWVAGAVKMMTTMYEKSEKDWIKKNTKNNAPAPIVPAFYKEVKDILAIYKKAGASMKMPGI